MNSILQQNVVLVLNKAWQAINIRTPEEVFPQLATSVATALDIDGANKIRPVTWEEWITLPVREQDRAVRTIHGGVHIPTVIVLANYAKVPKKRPKLCAKSIRERDGNRCRVHWKGAQPRGRIARPRRASLSRRQKCLGKPGMGEQGGQRQEGQPDAGGGWTQAVDDSTAPARGPGYCHSPERPSDPRVGDVPPSLTSDPRWKQRGSSFWG